MTIDLALSRRCRRLALLLGLGFAAAAAQAQTPPSGSGVDWDAQAAEQAPAPEAAPSRPPRARTRIQPYLEVAQVVSAELDGGDTLTYTSLAAGVDGLVHTRRVTVSMSYRYQRNIEWGNDVGDTDMHSGLAMLNAQIIPGTLQFDAGALATRTGGEGRLFGVTDRDSSVEVYSVFAGPTLSTQAGPIGVNAAYRLGYVAIDDDTGGAGLREDYDSAVSHAASLGVGMAPGRLPFGWGINAGYQRTDSNGEFDHEFEGAWIRGDVVVPVGPTLAFTAGVGYENIEASQHDIARNADGTPVIAPDGGPVADPSRPRVLTYDIDGLIYDAGLIWRPSARTELQARVGYRYGGTTFTGSLTHQFSPHTGMTATVYDSVSEFGGLLISDLSILPDEFEVGRDPLTGNLNGCVFGDQPGAGRCLDRSLQSIRGGTFRMRGASLVFSGSRNVWNWGAGAGFDHRRFGRPDDPAFDAFDRRTEQTFSLFASAGRRLSRSSSLGLNAFASWFDSNEADFDTVFTTGATLSYSRRFMLDRLSLLAALGLSHTDDGTIDSTVASGLLGLRYTF